MSSASITCIFISDPAFILNDLYLDVGGLAGVQSPIGELFVDEGDLYGVALGYVHALIFEPANDSVSNFIIADARLVG